MEEGQEFRQARKATYWIALFLSRGQNRQRHRDRKWIRGCLGLGGRHWRVTATGYGDSFGDDINILKLGSSDGCTALLTKTHSLLTLKG